MAGAGFKTFNTGDVLTSSDVNTYLMQQTVMVFDDASARSTALPTPSEGMFSYLKDTNLTYRYDGSAWLSDAGTTSPLTTKGDVWGYSTTDARIPVGANGTVLTADSSETLGVKWAAAAGGGKILQVIYADTSVAVRNSTSTYVDTGLTATITPSSASSKVLVLVSQSGVAKLTNDTSVKLRLLRGATELVVFEQRAADTNDSSYNNVGSATCFYLDSPATTSATTYKTQHLSVNNNTGADVQAVGATSTIILMEVGA